MNNRQEKCWKVQYGEEWHDYDATLAAIVRTIRSR